MTTSTEHLQTETIEQLKLLGYKDGDTVFYRAIGSHTEKPHAIFPNIPHQLTKLSTDGFNLYLVVNGGGDKDADVKTGKAIFYEHDDLEKEEQLYLWQSLDLPEPTFQVDTGGKSIHSYWVFETPVTIDNWRTLQTDLLNYSKGDKSIKNPSRVMRLAGYKHQKTGELASIVSRSGITYSLDTLRAFVPVASPKPERKEREQKQKDVKVLNLKQQATQSAGVIPLEECLAKNHRAILGGVGEGERNSTALSLARDLIGVESYLHSVGQNFTDDARSLFDRFCSGCNPSLSTNEADAIWGSANTYNPSPSCRDEGLQNILDAWNKKAPVSEEDKQRCPYYESSPAKGLVRVHLVKDDKAEPVENDDGTEGYPMKRARTRIGNHIDCIAYINNPESNGAALRLEFKSIRRQIVNWTMPRGYIVSDTAAMLSELFNMGYAFDLDKKKYLIEHLGALGADVTKTYTIVDSTGWVSDRYVSQHKTYGDGDLKFRDIEPTSEATTEIKGSLEAWKSTVGAKCAGNSRLLFFGLGVAFAAPLLAVTGMESGGFHLVGDSSAGKTTTLKVAASVTGEKTIPLWRTTTNGMESIATAHNHSLLPLDEIGQADPKQVGEVAYMLANGQGKTRMTKQLTNRKPKTWQLLFLSSGESGLGAYMAQAGITIKAGQEVRMPDIPAVPFGSAFGVFETIHGCESSKAFARSLESGCEQNRGVAIDAFLTRLLADRSMAFDGELTARVFAASKKLSEGTLNHAVSRVANRFGLIQVALELAHSYGILPFPFEHIEWGVKRVFTDWLTNRGGDGSIEIKNACDRIHHLIVSNEFSDRVFDPRKADGQIVRNLLGYRVADTDNSTLELLVPTTVFDKEFVDGVSKPQLITELQQRGWLASPGNDGRATSTRMVGNKKTRVYVFQPPKISDIDKTVVPLVPLVLESEPVTQSGFSLEPDGGSARFHSVPVVPAEPNEDPDILTDF